MKEIFTSIEIANIKTCVADVERNTSGEILPVVTRASSNYPRAEMLGSLALAFGVSLPAALLLHPYLGWGDLWTFMSFFAVWYIIWQQALQRIPAFKRLLIPQEEMEQAVEEASWVAFLEHGVHRTRDRTGVLIYVSLFERRVRILADDGIAAKVDNSAWETLVSSLVEAIRQGRTAQGLCATVKDCGTLVAGHFPRRADDVNELTDLVLDDDY